MAISHTHYKQAVVFKMILNRLGVDTQLQFFFNADKDSILLLKMLKISRCYFRFNVSWIADE